MQLHKNTILFALVVYLFTSTSSIFCALPEKYNAYHEKSSAIAQALAKQKNKLQDLADKAKASQPNSEEALLPGDEANEVKEAATPPAKSHTLRNICIGAGIVVVGVICAPIIKKQIEVAIIKARIAAAPAPANIQNVADIHPDPTYVDNEQEHIGACNVCFNDENLTHLNCGYSCCRDCLLQHVFTKYQNDRNLFDRIIVPGFEQAVLTREDIQKITHDNATMLRAYDIALLAHLSPGSLDTRDIDPATAAYLQAGVQCPQCNEGIERNGGCRHMTCRSCRHEFCWFCQANCPGGRHAYPDCNNSAYGVEEPRPAVQHYPWRHY